MTIFLMAGFSACGQKGPLQRPDADQLTGLSYAASFMPSGQYESILLPEQRAVC
jgi:predicted small lipoprotein YifL